MVSLSDDKQAFNTTSRYLEDILNINNVYTIQSFNLIKRIPLIPRLRF